ncbi:uncharacterized, partial [Tachysurus ichikawai]
AKILSRHRDRQGDDLLTGSLWRARPKLGRRSMSKRSLSEMKGHGIFPLTAVLTRSTVQLIMVVKLDFLRD